MTETMTALHELTRISEASTAHPYCLNCGDSFGRHSPDPAEHPCDVWSPSTLGGR